MGTQTRKISRNPERLRISTDLASKITDALHYLGYSELALQEIFDILVSGLIEQDEQSFSELLEQMGIIYAEDTDADDGNDEETAYVN